MTVQRYIPMRESINKSQVAPWIICNCKFKKNGCLVGAGIQCGVSDGVWYIFQCIFREVWPFKLWKTINPLGLSKWLSYVRTQAKAEMTLEVSGNSILYFAWCGVGGVAHTRSSSKHQNLQSFNTCYDSNTYERHNIKMKKSQKSELDCRLSRSICAL